ncbi:MAG: FHA domain-containing protein [Prevotellaceae bacterium]|nr:FHA domain-containing protein [Candidatus Minthosoma equi]
MASNIYIKCPHCGKVIGVVDNPNINNATFPCPVCKEKLKVGDCKRVVIVSKTKTSSEETQYGSSSGNASKAEETQYAQPSMPKGEETQFVGSNQPMKIGTLVDNYGTSYQLQSGINTIGRKAASSTASVQINVEDRYMSRSHAIIEVKNAGGQALHILRNGANKNPSYFNGTLVGDGDQLILNNGDRIKLGMTELIFKCLF